MTEIQQNRYDQLVRRIANIVSPGSMVGDALNELFPTIEVETLNAELSLLLSWRLGFASQNKLAVAANLNHIQLFNPVGSSHIVVIERIDIRVDADQFVNYALSNLALTNNTSNHALRDTREGILPLPIAQLRDVTQVAGIASFGLTFVQTNIIQTLQDKRGLFVLAPGTGVTFATTALNTGLMCSLLWRERVAEPAELNFP